MKYPCKWDKETTIFVHIKQNYGGGNKLIDKLGVMINTSIIMSLGTSLLWL